MRSLVAISTLSTNCCEIETSATSSVSREQRTKNKVPLWFVLKPMYCPQCGTESASSLQYCRVCGANLKVIGKAVSLSEAIARSDRGPLPKLKEMVRNFKLEHVTDEISGALDKMNEEIARSSDEPRPRHPWWHLREKKTPERRREDHR